MLTAITRALAAGQLIPEGAERIGNIVRARIGRRSGNDSAVVPPAEATEVTPRTSPEINKYVVDVLEGTRPAFGNRGSKLLRSMRCRFKSLASLLEPHARSGKTVAVPWPLTVDTIRR
jgi:hypothetical protein